MNGSVESYRLKGGETYWSIRYRVDKKQHRERGFPTRAQATKALRQRLVDIDKQQFVAPSQMPFDHFAEGWLERAESRLKPSTLASYTRNLAQHVSPAIGDVPLQRVDSMMIDGMFQKLLKQGLSATTVRYIGTIVGAVFADAHKRGLILRNPVLTATRPRSQERGQHDVWTADQVRQFLQFTRGDRLYPLWRLLLFTGVRRGEALGLTWDQVDVDSGTLTVTRSLVDAEWGRPVFSTPKTASGRRTIDIDEDTAEVLRQLRQRYAQERLIGGAGFNDHGLLFSHPDGVPMHPDRVSKVFRQSAKKAGVPVVRLHDLRHCHATLLLQAGVPAHVVQHRLGHAHVSITLGVYAAVMPKQDRDAAQAFAAKVAI